MHPIPTEASAVGLDGRSHETLSVVEPVNDYLDPVPALVFLFDLRVPHFLILPGHEVKVNLFRSYCRPCSAFARDSGTGFQ